MLAGFDVSQWNVVGKYPTGCAFAWIRASYGNGNDPHYFDHLSSIRHQFPHIVIGAYHFGVGGAQDPIVDQANRFLRQANPGGTALDADILALDLEANGKGPAMTEAEADRFIRQIQTAGRRIGLYHSRSGFPLNMAVHYNFRWVAQWGSTPPSGITWTFWQSSGFGIDRDYFRGDAAALAALVKASHV